MANEARVTASLSITKLDTAGSRTLLQYLSQPGAFVADVTGTKGPTPGAIRVPIGGVAADLSELTTPGWCWMMNLDETNYVEYGIRDPGADTFYQLGELGPGEINLVKLSRNLLEEYGPGTGTGTTAPTNQLWFKANTAACVVRVEAFER